MLDQFNNITSVKRKFKKLAALDAILSPEWDYRYYSYNSKWSDLIEMASMRDGCGNEWFLWLTDCHAAYKMFSKDDGYIDSPEALLKTLPNEYEHFVNEPAFSLDTISRIGYLNNGEWIYLGIDVKYLPLVERIYSMSKDDYFKWAYEYFEISVDTLLADAIWADPASLPTAKLINTDLDIDAFKLDLIEIGLTSRCTGADNG